MDAEAELQRCIAECTTPSPLADALRNSKLPFYVRNGSHRRAMEVLDAALHGHEDPESDPNYVPFMEMLSLILYNGDSLVQADAILDKVKLHARAHGQALSPFAVTLDQALRQSALYRLQHTMEHSGVDFDV